MNRGGSWNNDARNLRCANRDNDDPGKRNDNLGFRLASTGNRRSSRHHGGAKRPFPVQVQSPAPGVFVPVEAAPVPGVRLPPRGEGRRESLRDRILLCQCKRDTDFLGAEVAFPDRVLAACRRERSWTTPLPSIPTPT
ncbi:MAG: hypothetical protein HQL82_02690 [Magnetococcales bacterium]|nr:hypothetical protein [Magnetococcales bacterium]